MGPGFSFSDFFSVVSFNLISRIIAATIRTITILYGLVFMVGIFLLTAIPAVAWAITPIVTLPLYLVFKKPKESEVELILEKAKGDLKKLSIALFKHPQGQFIAWHLGFNPRYLSLYLNKQDTKGDFDLFQKRLKGKEATLQLSDLYETISDTFSPLKTLFGSIGIKTQDVYQTAVWYKQLQGGRKTPLIFDLERIKSLPGIGTSWAYGYTVEFDRYASDLTKRVSPYPLLIGREKEIRELERVLLKTQGNNTLVVGDPGVGRHIVVETLAHRIFTGLCLKALSHKRILSLDMHSLISAKPSISEVKGLASEILEEAKRAGNIIIVIDELDRYVSNDEGKIDLSSVFVKFAQSSVAFIGLTTPFGYHRYIENNPTVAPIFEKIEITQPSLETVLAELIISIVPILEKKHNILITLPAIKKAVEDADRFISNTPFPAKAIELLDEACVFVITKGKERLLSASHIDKVISEKLHIPLGELQKGEKEKLTHLEESLHKRIINQEEAVFVISSALRRARLNISNIQKPIGSFLFLGPTGVGKTETAKALSNVYFDNEEAMLRFDMSQYQKEEGLERLIGSLKLGLPGELTSKLSSHPFSLLLLDEFEKADREIYNLFLTLLDEGYVMDARGRKIEAKTTIIIATSNAGAEFIRERVKTGITSSSLQKELIEYVQTEKIFSPELINRFDAVVVFTPLSEGNLREVARIMLADLNKRLAAKEISVAVTDTLIKKLANIGFDPAFGARAMKRVIAEKIEDEVAKRLLSGNVKKGEAIEIEL